MVNIDLIKEVCFEVSAEPKLMAALLKYKPSLQNTEDNSIMKNHFHVVYLDLATGPKIVFQRGFHRLIEIPEINFTNRLKQLPQINFDEVCFLLATYGDEPQTPDLNNRIDFQKLPEKLNKLLEPSRGYLVYEEQGEELYRLLMKDDRQEAWKWLNNVKKFKKEGWAEYVSITLNGESLANYKGLFLNPEYAPSFRRKPVNETYDILHLISEDYQTVASYETWMHLRQDGLYLTDSEEDLFLEDQLIKSTLKQDGLGNYRIAFWLKNETFDLDQEIELGLNYKYGTYNNISGLTGWFIQANENQFILDFTATIELPDQSDFYSLSLKANFDFALPEMLKKNKMVYKLFP